MRIDIHRAGRDETRRPYLYARRVGCAGEALLVLVRSDRARARGRGWGAAEPTRGWLGLGGGAGEWEAGVALGS